jgi:hypothetical protein
MGGMSDQPSPERPADVDDRIEVVEVRRSPRYGVFLLLGAGLGVLVAMILTFAFGTGRAGTNGVVYSDFQVFGFLALICVALGLLVGGGIAILLEWTVGRRVRRLPADHERVHRAP